MPNDEIDVEDLKAEKKRSREQEKELEALREVVARIARQKRDYIIPQKKRSNTLRLGVCSDLHIGSMFERSDALTQFLRLCDSEKVDRVMVPGDILDGHRVYKGQEFEIYAHGFDRQIKAAEDKIPKIKTPVEFIAGNHDLSFKVQAGALVGDQLQAKLPGWTWRGDEAAAIDFRVGGRVVRVGLAHPGGTGSSYAISYRPQKMAESLPGGQKPNVLLIGHYHKAEHIPAYRNITLVQAGTFQSQTPFMANKGLSAHVGGWILEIVVGSGKSLVQRVKGEFVSFYEPER